MSISEKRPVMRGRAAAVILFLSACAGGGESEPQTKFYRVCIREGYSERVCSCMDTFAQSGDNPYGSVDRLLKKCRKYG
jgi:hypothetical protein